MQEEEKLQSVMFSPENQRILLLLNEISKLEERNIKRTEKDDITMKALKETVNMTSNLALVGEAGETISCIERRIINASVLIGQLEFEFIYHTDDGSQKIISDKSKIPLNVKVKKILISAPPDTIYFTECDPYNCPTQSPNGGNPDCPVKKAYDRDMRLCEVYEQMVKEEIKGEEKIIKFRKGG